MSKIRKILFFIFITLFFGCYSQKKQSVRHQNFIPPPQNATEIQINPIPHPFNVNGTSPFAVWLDGKRLPLDNSEIIKLTNSLNIKYQAPNN